MRPHQLARVLAVLLTVPPLSMALASPSMAAEEPSEVALRWQETALSTVPFSPATSLYLAFTSRAVHKAVTQSLRHPDSSETAAVATAAHDVLIEYFPGATSLDATLADSLAGVPDGPAEDNGVAIGASAAAGVIADRADDGRGDPSVVYDKEPGIGVWEPDLRGMATPWYGFVDRLTGGRPVPVDGPDPVGSAAYRADLAEVQADGAAGADADKAAVATFFNVNGFALYRRALIGYLRTSPLGLSETTDLFADLDVSTGEALRQTWRLKFNYGFWRPTAAIGSDDGDPLTPPQPGWSSVLPVPPYPEYPSGHGALTAAFAQTVRCHLGDDIPLTLEGAGGTRSYTTLSSIEDDAFVSRIWGGIHFRDAMDDAYVIGHEVAARMCD
ncbi:MAG: hypothetical protein WCA30_13425 [Dermatophilaceae bacterium]